MSRVGPAVWSFNSTCPGDIYHFDLEVINFTENPLAITFWARFSDEWKLFDVSTTETDASDKFPLIEPGRIDFDLKVEWLKWARENSLVKLSPDRHILLTADVEKERHNETIDIHYSDSGGANFSFVTRISIPIPEDPEDLDFELLEPKLAFSADGSKFAIAMNDGRVGKLGKEVMVFLECMRFSLIQAGELYMLNLTEHSKECLHWRSKVISGPATFHQR
ncbi:uncharacterized protein LACBIDRAFT_333976 [Laccaria bicolor S238N-H82]|uniref:Predicted protein n=1 Tax=Laccaria bicolor (strain S238N-H82 / ATCC MYA-4686) TaxID=486041 RepID=B0DXP6_LACBS|nr:uncharacterized protein LACBIDRAFT_333976 [Laccaria bicolor S238N-H82]EDR00719.1 predicted protein [Laccaria bicolor S238N-H82]|eukprot:XP_001888728.1 predicted protein [Laccaria bicolor S238N-H82]